MNIKKRFASMLAAISFVSFGSIAVNAISVFSLLTQPAQAQNASCPAFTGRVLGFQVNVRSGPSTSYSIVRAVGPNVTLNFSGWEYGQTVNDYWTGQPDNKWFKLADGSGWVASAVIAGNPPSGSLPISQCGQPNNMTAEQFFKWAVGQTNIARLDNQPGLNGQCVSLIARYIAEVYLPANQKNQYMTLGNGKDTASVVSRTFSQYFQPLTNVGLPKRGAIISFPSISAPYGHVAIVMAAQQLSNGQRQVKIMDSNGPQGKVVKEQTWWINIPDGRNQGYGTGIVWTNPK